MFLEKLDISQTTHILKVKKLYFTEQLPQKIIPYVNKQIKVNNFLIFRLNHYSFDIIIIAFEVELI